MITQFINYLSDAERDSWYEAWMTFKLRAEDGTIQFKKVNINDDTQQDILDKYKDSTMRYLSVYLPNDEWEDFECLKMTEYDYTKKAVYYFDNTQWNEIIDDLHFMEDDYRLNTDTFNIEDIKKIEWIIITIWTATTFMNLFIPYLPIYTLSPDKWFIIWAEMNDQFKVKESQKLIRFNMKPSFIYNNSKLLVLDFKKLEKDFNFVSKLEERAESKVNLLKEHNLLTDTSTLDSLASKKVIRNKLLKLKDNSPIFTMNKDEIIGFVRSNQDKLKNIKISDDWKFDIKSESSAKIFLKIIDDDYVKSMLTWKAYETEKKMEI